MTPLDKNSETKNMILATALDMVKKEGFESMTIRKIAARSNTNISLVNYYFGSKDQLISEVMKILLSGFHECFKVLEDAALPPKERLKSFLLQYASVIQEHPELLSRILTMGDRLFPSQYEYGSFMQASGFHLIHEVLRDITHERQPEALMTMMMHIFGAVFMPILMKPILETGAGLHIAPLEQQIDILFERYFLND